MTEQTKDSADVVGRLVASLSELLGPLENASAEMVRLGKVADQNAEAAFDRAREAIADGEALRDLLATPSPAPAVAENDTRLIDALRDESWDLRCFDVPTGGGDADIGWRVVSHYMAPPRERVVAEVYHDDPRAAIQAAIRANGGEG